MCFAPHPLRLRSAPSPWGEAVAEKRLMRGGYKYAKRKLYEKQKIGKVAACNNQNKKFLLFRSGRRENGARTKKEQYKDTRS